MKQHITTIKNRAIDWLFKRIHIVERHKSYTFDPTSQQFSETSAGLSDAVKNTDIAVLRKSTYVSFEKRYKVISQKELKGIVANELDFHSPFQSSYALYKLRQLDEGTWQVTYYFADLEDVPQLSRYRLVLIWDDFIRFWIGDANMPVLVNSPIAQQHVTKDDGVVVVSDIDPGSLKQRILIASADNELEQQALTPAQFSDHFLQYLLTFPWISLAGAINRERWLPKRKAISLNPKQLALVASAIGVAMVLESVWLTALDYHFDRQMTSTADIREQYSAAKSAYLKELVRFGEYADVVKQRSAASSIPQLLSNYPQKSDIRIDRMDYLQGEVRLGGIAGDIETLMAYLSAQGAVQDLAFMSPITQDKRTGKDRFSIRFDWRNE